jgi:hypothetical protein
MLQVIGYYLTTAGYYFAVLGILVKRLNITRNSSHEIVQLVVLNVYIGDSGFMELRCCGHWIHFLQEKCLAPTSLAAGSHSTFQALISCEDIAADY